MGLACKEVSSLQLPTQAPWYLFFMVFRRPKIFTVEPVDFQDPLVALHETLTEISDWLTVGSSTQFQPAFHRAHCCTTNLSSPLNPKRSWLAVDVTFNTPSATPSHAQPLPKRLNATLEKALQIWLMENCWKKNSKNPKLLKLTFWNTTSKKTYFVILDLLGCTAVGTEGKETIHNSLT